MQCGRASEAGSTIGADIQTTLAEIYVEANFLNVTPSPQRNMQLPRQKTPTLRQKMPELRQKTPDPGQETPEPKHETPKPRQKTSSPQTRKSTPKRTRSACTALGGDDYDVPLDSVVKKKKLSAKQKLLS